MLWLFSYKSCAGVIMNYQYIVELESGVWLARWECNLGKTLLKKYAAKWTKEVRAKKALAKARKVLPFENAKVVRLDK